ncbi:MAG: 2-succinyl-6-hydroxy-2,4-cyclohexadiene-1-carboxylate synthase [Myxococcota bacterium]
MLLHTTSWHSSALGCPWVLLHGFTGDGRDFQPVVDALGGALDAPLVALDLVGHGRSAAPEDAAEYTMEACVRHIVETMDGLQVERARVLGYSMGGRAALHLALRHPERVESLVCVGATPGIEEEALVRARVEADQALADRIERDGVEAFLAFWASIPIIATQRRIAPEHARAMARRRRTRSALGLAWSLRAMGTGAMPELWGELDQVSCEALLVVGEEDLKFREIAERMGKIMPHARVSVIEGAGHAAHLERPEAFASALIGWKGRDTAL